MASNNTTAAPVKRACDSCHRRKVKCIGEGTSSCKNCVTAGLACTYNAIPQKKGPKGSRAKVLSELRESQRNAALAASTLPELGLDGRGFASPVPRTQGLLAPALVDNCVEFYFANVYPSEPVLHRQSVQDAIINMERSNESYCVVVALCAYVLLHANMKPTPDMLPRPDLAHVSNISLGHALLEECIRLRNGCDHCENPSLTSVLTTWFCSGCYGVLGRENTAWYLLREAASQAHILGWQDEQTYKQGPLDMSRSRVLFWLLFIAERAHALHKHRPITLHPTIHLPSLEEVSSDRPVAIGLELQINLYKIVDETFIGIWNGVHTHANPAWAAQLQTQLLGVVPTYLECTEAQAVDIRITHHWLRAMAWQLCVSQGLVSSVASDSSMTFKYPIEISRDLLSATHQFSQQAMEIHGMELIHKLFDVACCLIDVVAVTSYSPEAFALGPREYVSRFVTLISTLRAGQSRYLPLLLAKLSDVLPTLPLPRSLSLTQGAPTSAMGHATTATGALPPHVAEDYLMAPVTASTHPSTNLIRQLAAQTGVPLPLNSAHSSMLQASTRQVENMSLYDSSHGTSHSSSADARSTATTPGAYEPSVQHARPQLLGHPAIQIPSSHSQHSLMSTQHIVTSPTRYDARYPLPQDFPVDPSMYKQ